MPAPCVAALLTLQAPRATQDGLSKGGGCGHREGTRAAVASRPPSRNPPKQQCHPQPARLAPAWPPPPPTAVLLGVALQPLGTPLGWAAAAAAAAAGRALRRATGGFCGRLALFLAARGLSELDQPGRRPPARARAGPPGRHPVGGGGSSVGGAGGVGSSAGYRRASTGGSGGGGGLTGVGWAGATRGGGSGVAAGAGGLAPLTPRASARGAVLPAAGAFWAFGCGAAGARPALPAPAKHAVAPGPAGPAGALAGTGRRAFLLRQRELGLSWRRQQPRATSGAVTVRLWGGVVHTPWPPPIFEKGHVA